MLTPARPSRVLSLPNVLTYGRIVAVPAMVACFDVLSGDAAQLAACAIFIAAGITDFFDGYLARAWEQQSTLGRMLDPIADKLLVGVALMVLVANRTIESWSVWAAIIILSREILVSGLREFLAELKVSIPVTWLAKWKTAVQMIAIGFLLAGPALDKHVPGTLLAGLGLLWIAALLTLYTGYDYLKASVRHAIEL